MEKKYNRAAEDIGNAVGIGHVNVRIEPRHSFGEVRRAALALAREVERRRDPESPRRVAVQAEADLAGEVPPALRRGVARIARLQRRLRAW